MSKLSSTAVSLITLLNNMDELIVISNNRIGAKDTMRAMKVYAESKNFPLPEEKIQNFYAVLIDSRPYTLSSLLRDLAQDIIRIDSKR